ncbi:4401_t:CDS:2, partial [Cetraspora pellucida]
MTQNNNNTIDLYQIYLSLKKIQILYDEHRSKLLSWQETLEEIKKNRYYYNELLILVESEMTINKNLAKDAKDNISKLEKNIYNFSFLIIVNKDKKVWISQHINPFKDYYNKWQVVGSGKNSNVSYMDCEIREAKEEVGVNIKLEDLTIINNHSEWILVDLKKLVEYDMTDFIKEHMSIISEVINKKFCAIRNAESKKRSAANKKCKEIEGVEIEGVETEKEILVVKNVDSAWNIQASNNENDQIFIVNYMFERAEINLKQKKSIDYIDIWKQHVLFQYQKIIDNEKTKHQYTLFDIEKFNEKWFWFKNQINSEHKKRKIIKQETSGKIYCIIYPSMKFHLYDKKYVKYQHRRICDKCHKFCSLDQITVSNTQCDINCIFYNKKNRIEKEYSKNICCEYFGLWNELHSCDN